MTDHADTIRRFFAMCQPVQYHAGAWGPPTEALDALLAERQQAIDERDEWKAEAERSKLPKRDALDLFRLRHDYPLLEARCEQAIDALREIDCMESPLGVEYAAQLYAEVKALAAAALLNLGEQP